VLDARIICARRLDRTLGSTIAPDGMKAFHDELASISIGTNVRAQRTGPSPITCGPVADPLRSCELNRQGCRRPERDAGDVRRRCARIKVQVR